MAADVCRVLGYPESTIKNSLSNLIDHVPVEFRCKKRILVSSRNRHGAILREVETWFLKLEGVNTFLNRSDKPNAIPFQKWVNGEVLPEIFKTGRYQIGPPEAQAPATIDNRQLAMLIESMNKRDDQFERLLVANTVEPEVSESKDLIPYEFAFKGNKVRTTIVDGGVMFHDYRNHLKHNAPDSQHLID
jgi:prophage antirepressor-like protein